MFAHAKIPLEEDIVLFSIASSINNEQIFGAELPETKYMVSGDNLSVSSEEELLRQINKGLSAEVWRIYNEFLAKRRDEVLTVGEAETLAKISDDIEWINNHRMLLMIELAGLQKRNFDEVLQEFAGKEQILPEKNLDFAIAAFILERSKGVCEYCRRRIEHSLTPYLVETIMPKTKGGKIEPDNLTLICQGCANHKYLKTEGFDIPANERSALFDPRRDDWNVHFSWSEDASLIVGLTTKGRTTINEINLNRPTLIEHRAILAKIERK